MAKYYINTERKIGHINAEIYSHFSEHLGRCIYEGLYVGEDSPIPNTNGMRNDVVNALKKMGIPVLRWPGGCFADEYHWKDGIGPKESRKKMINTHWGGVVENNHFGTHEFLELCRQLECKPYINGNVGSGSVREMSEWVEYMTFDGTSPMADMRKENGREEPWKIDYFGVGNENWGGGGNMTPEYYANLYRHYQTFLRNYRSGHSIYKIACGPNSSDYRWTEQLMKIAGGFMDGLSLHHYTFKDGWDEKGSATEFTEHDWYKTMRNTWFMEELIRKHSSIMDQYDPEKRVGLIVDEWGNWFDVEPGTNPGFLYQQNTIRDAVVAGINLNIFNKHCDRVKMANIAQLVNVLQSVILTEGEKMLLTPTYHIFHMYKGHQNAELIESHIETEMIGLDENIKVPNLSESCSVDKQGILHITITNASHIQSYPIEVFIRDNRYQQATGSIVSEDIQEHNTFLQPNLVMENEFRDFTIEKSGKIHFTIPPHSVLMLELEKSADG